MLVGAELVEVGEDLGVGSALAGRHHAYHLPVTCSKVKLLPQARVRVSFGDGLAHHHLPLAGFEPPARVQLKALSHLDADGFQAADVDVHTVRRVHTHEINHAD